jgi:predicted enzyme related to lactoylglutathione lyase
MAQDHIVWFEIDVPDAEKASAFYSAVFGWTFDSMPGMEGYPMAKAGEKMLGALQASEDAEPAGRGVRLYFEVDDLEAAVERVRSAGGTVESERHEIPGGWIALVNDPFGQKLGLWTGKPAS